MFIPKPLTELYTSVVLAQLRGPSVETHNACSFPRSFPRGVIKPKQSVSKSSAAPGSFPPTNVDCLFGSFFFLRSHSFIFIFFTNLFFRPVVLASARIGFPVMLPHCSEFSYYIFFTVHCLTAPYEVPCQRFCPNKEELTATEVIRSYLFTIVIYAKKKIQ